MRLPSLNKGAAPAAEPTLAELEAEYERLRGEYCEIARRFNTSLRLSGDVGVPWSA